ncbi:MAG: Gfo/Idh/MocA family oxidoreductase [Bryobacterales bacterium]|nr:Gfo/Idh/MocA family oxidoreductase [Bryobacterales bacterium]
MEPSPNPTRRRATGALAFTAASASRIFGANGAIRIGCIGAGGRAQALLRNIERIPNARIAAVCDVWTENLEKAKQLAGPAAFATRDYRDLLARQDVDAVIIGAPDHQHVPLTSAACRAGKDVYVEKPLTHSRGEEQAVLLAVRETGRIVQVGTQQRSMPHMKKSRDLVLAGKIGKVHKAHITWNRNAPRAAQRYQIDPRTVDWASWLGPARAQSFDPYRFRQWRWFSDFGGGIFTDLMVHQIDIVHWILNLQHPASAASIGDWFSAKGIWETPDTVQTILRYPESEVQVYFEGTFSNARNAAMIELMGSDGTLYLDRGRYELYPETRTNKFSYEEWVLGDGGRGADFYAKPNGELLHLTDWVEAIRARRQPVAPVEAGVGSAAAAHLANQALRSGQVAKWSA